MSQDRRIRCVAVVMLVAIGMVGIACGCYSKVVGGTGIGADSDRLRKNHEYGSERPFEDFVTTEQDRRQR